MIDGTMEGDHEKYSGKGHLVFLEGTLQGDACNACKKGWLTAPKDALCLYNILPTSEAAEILFFLPLSLLNFCSSVIIYIIRHCIHIDR